MDRAALDALQQASQEDNESLEATDKRSGGERMPIFVTVQPNEDTHAECLIYRNGAPMLAIHDPSASVMISIGQSPGSAVFASQFATELIQAGTRFEHEARRCVVTATGVKAPQHEPRSDTAASPWFPNEVT